MTKNWLASIVWMALAAIMAIEAYVKFIEAGFKSGGFWLFSAIFAFSVFMFFRYRKLRNQEKIK